MQVQHTKGTHELDPADISTQSDHQVAPLSNAENAKKVDEQDYLLGLRLYLIVLALLIACLLLTIDVSIISTAIPRITDTFHTIEDQGWYAAGFTFSNSALLPMSGKIYSFFPMKISFILFLAVFEVGSLICATSVSSSMFIVGRVVAGLGGSGIINGSLSILALISPPEERPLFMGLIISVASAGQVMGPLIGGALTQTVSWRWCFYINVPCGALAVLFLCLIHFPDNSSSRRKFVKKSIVKDFDIVGFLIFVPALTMLLLALQWGGIRYTWSSATIIGLLIGAIVALFSLCWWEYRQGNDAMFPVPLLRRRIILCACIASFVTGGVLLIVTYYLPLWFQTVKTAGPLTSAIHTLPLFLTQIVFAMILGVICPRFIPYLTPFAITGNMINAAGTGAITSFLPTTSTAKWIGFQLISGAGRGMSVQIPTQTVQQHVEKKEIAVGTAMVTFSNFFGGALFLAVGQTTFSNLLKSALRQYAPGLDPELVISSGATDVRNQIPAQYRNGVTLSYNSAIRRTFYLGLGASIMGMFISFGLGWKKIEKKANPSKVDKEKTENGNTQPVVSATNAE